MCWLNNGEHICSMTTNVSVIYQVKFLKMLRICCLSKEHSCKKTKQWKSDHKMVLFDYITLILIWKIYSIDMARWLRKVWAGDFNDKRNNAQSTHIFFKSAVAKMQINANFMAWHAQTLCSSIFVVYYFKEQEVYSVL